MLVVLPTTLRPHRERPRNCRAIDKRDELPPSHSITSSARTRSAGGIALSSSFAVLRFTNSSKFRGCSIGSSLSFAPFAMRAT